MPEVLGWRPDQISEKRTWKHRFTMKLCSNLG